MKIIPSVERGGGQFADCLRFAVASLSDTCKERLARSPPRSLMVTSDVDRSVGFGVDGVLTRTF